MPKRAVPRAVSQPERLTRSEQRAARTDAAVKRDLAAARIVDDAKTSHLKALRKAKELEGKSDTPGDSNPGEESCSKTQDD